MPTNNNTTVSQELQTELGLYKATYDEAKAGAGNENFFGYKACGDKVELKFDASPKEIQKAGMELAIVAPDLKSVDLLATTNFEEIKTRPKEDLRGFLRRIIDEIR